MTASVLHRIGFALLVSAALVLGIAHIARAQDTQPAAGDNRNDDSPSMDYDAEMPEVAAPESDHFFGAPGQYVRGLAVPLLLVLVLGLVLFARNASEKKTLPTANDWVSAMAPKTSPSMLIVHVVADAYTRVVASKMAVVPSPSADPAEQALHGTKAIARVILRERSAWHYANLEQLTYNDVDTLVSKFEAQVSAVRARFNYVGEERAQAHDVSAVADDREVVIASFVVASRTKFFEGAPPEDVATLRTFLETLPEREAATLLAAEVVWTPASADSLMRLRAVKTLYPDLIKLTESNVPRVACPYCHALFAGDRAECPICGAPYRASIPSPLAR
ncbi:MAG: DUF1517 domain-containing protein [Sandaracinaceae bacterium]|nr:DUF1517 domain-containing protein [Sandaracinaceae bacterium]